MWRPVGKRQPYQSQRDLIRLVNHWVVGAGGLVFTTSLLKFYFIFFSLYYFFLLSAPFWPGSLFHIILFIPLSTSFTLFGYNSILLICVVLIVLLDSLKLPLHVPHWKLFPSLSRHLIAFVFHGLFKWSKKNKTMFIRNEESAWSCIIFCFCLTVHVSVC